MRIALQNSHRQRGISLFIVLVILLLSLIVVLGGLAVTKLNEVLVGNQSDTQRAYGAAQALLDAAQRDIRLNGRYCDAPELGEDGHNPTIQVNGEPVECTLRYPSDGNGLNDYMTLVSLLGGVSIGGDISVCGGPDTDKRYIGVCISGNPTNVKFQVGKIDTKDSALQPSNGADYLQPIGTGKRTLIGALTLDSHNQETDYGGTAKAGVDDAITGKGSVGLGLMNSNDKTSKSRGKYWVEIFPYNVMDQSWKPTAQAPDGTYPFVFRITVRAEGLKLNTVSILRTYYVPYPIN
jgi:Tfp pilus assembly protein PilX